MADCCSLPNAAEKISLSMNAGARAIEQNKKLHGVYYCIDPLRETKEIAYLEAAIVLRQNADAIERLIAENAKLKAERNAAAEVIKSILQSSGDIDLCMLCGYGNVSSAKCTEPNGREWCLKNAKWVGAE